MESYLKMAIRNQVEEVKNIRLEKLWRYSINEGDFGGIVIAETLDKALEQIQDKYKFKNNYQLEAHDVYDFCNDIRQAYYLGLCIDEEDLEFIEMVLDKISS